MKPRVRVLTTGGTISTKLQRGVARMTFDVNSLISKLNLNDVNLETSQLMRKGSMEMTPSDWQTIARATADAVGEGVDGVVVLHGTDTLHYTAAALSFMLRGLSVPVVMTGSMVPGGEPGSDSLPNIRDAVNVAAHSNTAEVCVVFSADAKRTRGVIIRGCRAKKVRSAGLDAFGSINAPPLGFVKGSAIQYTTAKRRRRGVRKLELVPDLEPRAVLVKLHPGVDVVTLRRFLRGAKGAVLEGTGVGHVKTSLHGVVSRFGMPAVMTTQAQYGGERLGTYDVDQEILAIKNLIPARDMSSEAALVKLMWVLPQGGDVRSKMLENVSGEIGGQA